jgi:hypothetical protein
VNARDAMRNGGTLTLRSEKISSAQLEKQFADAKEDEYIHLQITYTGEGMEKNTRTRFLNHFLLQKSEEKVPD